MLKTVSRSVVLLLVLPVLALAGAVPQFQDGDRWCAVGDSITHNGRYHDYIYLFYAIRFPDRAIEFHNCGISGDTAGGTLRRFDADIAPHKPTVATIMLGMNDVSRGLYDPKLKTPDVQPKREAAKKAYAANMKKLAEKLHGMNARLIFVTPSIFDQTATIEKENLPGVNDALGRCAEIGRELAKEFGGTVVDFHGPMGEINLAQQKADPKFTLIGADRIHPAEVGHFVMAYLFLKAQGVPRCVADMAVDAGGKREVEFEKKEEALPFPVPAACEPALKLVPFMEEMNQERLRVSGLPAGRYTLAIDGEKIGSYSPAELEAGINLAAIKTTPQYRQALEVAKLDAERFALQRQMRGIEYVELRMGRRSGDLTPFDYQAKVKQMLGDGHLTGWPRDRVLEYEKLKPQQEKMLKRLGELIEGIRKGSEPKMRQFVIRGE